MESEAVCMLVKEEFSCKRCGMCCCTFTNVEVTEEEAAAVGMDNVDKDGLGTIRLRKVNPQGVYAWAVGGSCALYDPERGCTVHDGKKPGVCERFSCGTGWGISRLVAAVAMDISYSDVDDDEKRALLRSFLKDMIRIHELV